MEATKGLDSFPHLWYNVHACQSVSPHTPREEEQWPVCRLPCSAPSGLPWTGTRSPSSRTRYALLAHLVVEGDDPHRREKLAGLLWPGWSEKAARNNLRHTLAVLRKSIGDRETSEPALDITRQTVQHAPPATSGPKRQGLYRAPPDHDTAGPAPSLVGYKKPSTSHQGDFLQDFSLPDSPEFEEWGRCAQPSSSAWPMDTLHGLADLLAERGEYERALQHARRQTELDSWARRVRRRTRRQCVCWPSAAAAVKPWPSTRPAAASWLKNWASSRARRRCSSMSRSATASSAPGMTASQAPELRAEPPPFLVTQQVEAERPVFVAREGELAQLDGYLDLAVGGQGRVVFVTGEAGSGKTALIQEFAERAQASHSDLVAAGGQGNAQTGIGDPYLPFREALELLTGDVEPRLAAGAMTREHALRLWQLSPVAAQALVEAGQGLIRTPSSPGLPLLHRARAFSLAGADWLPRLAELVGRVPVPVRDDPRLTAKLPL